MCAWCTQNTGWRWLGHGADVGKAEGRHASECKVTALVQHVCDLRWQIVRRRLQRLSEVPHPTLCCVVTEPTSNGQTPYTPGQHGVCTSPLMDTVKKLVQETCTSFLRKFLASNFRASSCKFGWRHTKQESPANAKGTRDSSACMKAHC